MSTLKKSILGLCLLFLMAAKSNKHSIWFVVSNSSVDRQPVSIQFNVSGRNENIVVAEQDLAAGTHQLPERKIKEGVYQAVISADGQKVSASQPFTLDSDRWILVNYIREDSASIVRSYGWIDTTRFKKIDGQYASINISVNQNRPAGL